MFISPPLAVERNMTNKTANIERRAISINEMIKICGLSRATIYKLIKSKKLTTIKIGGRRLVTISAIDVLLNEGT